MNISFVYPPASEASRGVNWNQAQINFTHPYTEFPWVTVTLSLCDSEANKPPIISAAFHGIGPKKFLGPIGHFFWLINYPDWPSPFAGGPWDLPLKFHLYLIIAEVDETA